MIPPTRVRRTLLTDRLRPLHLARQPDRLSHPSHSRILLPQFSHQRVHTALTHRPDIDILRRRQLRLEPLNVRRLPIQNPQQHHLTLVELHAGRQRPLDHRTRIQCRNGIRRRRPADSPQLATHHATPQRARNAPRTPHRARRKTEPRARAPGVSTAPPVSARGAGWGSPGVGWERSLVVPAVGCSLCCAAMCSFLRVWLGSLSLCLAVGLWSGCGGRGIERLTVWPDGVVCAPAVCAPGCLLCVWCPSWGVVCAGGGACRWGWGSFRWVGGGCSVRGPGLFPTPSPVACQAGC